MYRKNLTTSQVGIVLSIIIALLIMHSYALESGNTCSSTTNQAVPLDTLKVSTKQDSVVKVFYGEISYYGEYFQNRNTASGKKFDMYDPKIIAHRTLPFGTKVRITNESNGKILEGIVQDRGPYVRGREMDVSYAGARLLGFEKKGVQYVKIEVYSKS